MFKINIKLFRLISFFYFWCISILSGQPEYKSQPFKVDLESNINNIKVLNLSSIANELTFIPLETTPNCLIQKIRKILFSNSYIFVSEFTNLLEFDRNGKFIRKIGSSGTGPGEYLSIGDFCINERKQEIYIIFSSASKLLIYGFDGVFKKSINLSFRPAQVIQRDPQSLMFHLWNIPGKNDPSWIITNLEGISLTVIKNSLKRVSQPGFLINHTPLYSFANSLHFMEFGIDTLFYFKDARKSSYAILSLGDFKMDADPIITATLIKDEKLLTKVWPGTILENNEYLFIKFYRGISNNSMTAIYDKRLETVTILKDEVFKNDLIGGIGFWPKQIVNDHILIDYADAFDLLKKNIPVDLRSKISETSNPVLMILK